MTTYDAVMSCSKTNSRDLCVSLLNYSDVMCIADTAVAKAMMKPVFIPNFP